jgi:hypothetical protein
MNEIEIHKALDEGLTLIVRNNPDYVVVRNKLRLYIKCMFNNTLSGLNPPDYDRVSIKVS